MTLEELRSLREKGEKAMAKRENAGKDIQVIVGMGTSGIAAGAKQVVDCFLDLLDQKGIHNVLVSQTGAMGLGVEPTVEVTAPGMPATVYEKVDKAVVEAIIDQHIIGKKQVSDHVVRPAEK
ncbi:MAG: (2Fe-2S) ferredoxin domain-containing protein [Sphaerochaetaceae bacterium]|nr:(2Fe-2S) ferredoxin domain-containing protein [Spirochaetales bacterium]MDY5499392.1 (2Fe-2S) ferredoxin domain-containing protein [Sphaerochaetaceae bacterium]